MPIPDKLAPNEKLDDLDTKPPPVPIDASSEASTATGPKTKVLEFKHLVQQNPTALRSLVFVIGFALLVISILALVQVWGAAFKPSQFLTNGWNIVFGFVICLSEAKESWANASFDLQNKLFKWVPALATQTGKACFHFYVGSVTLLMLPDEDLWKVIYFGMGGGLVLAAVLMLITEWCGCCLPDKRNAAVEP